MCSVCVHARLVCMYVCVRALSVHVCVDGWERERE